MPESFSLEDLFSKTCTREQFIEKYKEIKSSGEVHECSIFDDGMDETVDAIFDAVDTDKDGSISENELVALKGLGKDDKNILSGEDLEVVYEQVITNILDKYKDIDNPEKMYANALKASDNDMRCSSYVQDLDSDIAILTELLNNRRTSATTKINNLEAEINELLNKSKKLDKDTQEQYKKETETINDFRRKLAENQAKLLKAEKEFAANQNDIELMNREISTLDKEKDKDEISLKQKELSDLIKTNSGLANTIDSCKKESVKLLNLIQTSQRKILGLRSEALKKNDNIKSRIGQLQAQIFAEQAHSDNDINNYKNKINQLQSAKTYAYKQIPANVSNEIVASHNNDNAVTFEELKSQGVKYSSAKGQRLAQDVGSHATGFIGKCSNRVANGLQRTGLGNERMPSAYQMDDALRRDIASGKNNNFREIKINSLQELKNLPAGCIVVYEANASWNNGFKTGYYNAKHGHIEVTLGNGTAASDGITRNIRYSERMSVFVPVERA